MGDAGGRKSEGSIVGHELIFSEPVEHARGAAQSVEMDRFVLVQLALEHVRNVSAVEEMIQRKL